MADPREPAVWGGIRTVTPPRGTPSRAVTVDPLPVLPSAWLGRSMWEAVGYSKFTAAPRSPAIAAVCESGEAPSPTAVREYAKETEAPFCHSFGIRVYYNG